MTLTVKFDTDNDAFSPELTGGGPHPAGHRQAALGLEAEVRHANFPDSADTVPELQRT
jgi:hypothetical protein